MARPIIYYKLLGLRTKHGYSPEYMAEKLGITARAYKNKETGKSEFKLNELIVITDLFKLSVEAIFLDDYLAPSEVLVDKELKSSLKTSFESGRNNVV